MIDVFFPTVVPWEKFGLAQSSVNRLTEPYTHDIPSEISNASRLAGWMSDLWMFSENSPRASLMESPL